MPLDLSDSATQIIVALLGIIGFLVSALVGHVLGYRRSVVDMRKAEAETKLAGAETEAADAEAAESEASAAEIVQRISANALKDMQDKLNASEQEKINYLHIIEELKALRLEDLKRIERKQAEIALLNSQRDTLIAEKEQLLARIADYEARIVRLQARIDQLEKLVPEVPPWPQETKPA